MKETRERREQTKPEQREKLLRVDRCLETGAVASQVPRCQFQLCWIEKWEVRGRVGCFGATL